MSECIDGFLACVSVLSCTLRGAAPVPEENAEEEPEQSGEQERERRRRLPERRQASSKLA